jgi:hypothetical protein
MTMTPKLQNQKVNRGDWIREPPRRTSVATVGSLAIKANDQRHAVKTSQKKRYWTPNLEISMKFSREKCICHLYWSANIEIYLQETSSNFLVSSEMWSSELKFSSTLTLSNTRRNILIHPSLTTIFGTRFAKW